MYAVGEKRKHMKTMKRFFYLHFTDKVIAPLFIAYCWCIGIRKGKMFIVQRPGYTNKMDGGMVGWSEIKSFSWVWATRTKFGFDIKFHTYLNDAEKLGLKDVFIQSQFYDSSICTIKEVRRFLKAQPLLQHQYKTLYKPAIKIS